jgi:hypothetical protein
MFSPSVFFIQMPFLIIWFKQNILSNILESVNLFKLKAHLRGVVPSPPACEFFSVTALPGVMHAHKVPQIYSFFDFRWPNINIHTFHKKNPDAGNGLEISLSLIWGDFIPFWNTVGHGGIIKLQTLWRFQNCKSILVTKYS